MSAAAAQTNSIPSNEEIPTNDSWNASEQSQQQQNQQQQIERQMSNASIQSVHSVQSQHSQEFETSDFVSAPANVQQQQQLNEGDFGMPQQQQQQQQQTDFVSLPASPQLQQSQFNDATSLSDSVPEQQHQQYHHQQQMQQQMQQKQPPSPISGKRDVRKEYLEKIREELEKKAKLEREEIETIKEEAVAELELLRSTRKKMIDANIAKNRNEQEHMEEVMATETGWEAVASLITDENLCPSQSDAKPRPTDVAKMRALIKTLKYKKPLAVEA